MRHRTQSAFSLPVMTYATVTDLEGQLWKASPSLVIFSLLQGNQATVSTLKVLLDLIPTVPVIVEIAIEAVRFCIRGRGA
jgi:hypothetical protein